MAKTIRVMVAEDFPLLREDFCDVVSAQSDMEVVGSAASGEEIASLADTVPCDVILMDIEMETIDAGIRAAEVITARHPEVKILFLTAHETDDMITSAMGTGAVDYVVKGCEEERLLEHIRRASEGRAELDPKIQTRTARVAVIRSVRSAARCWRRRSWKSCMSPAPRTSTARLWWAAIW